MCITRVGWEVGQSRVTECHEFVVLTPSSRSLSIFMSIKTYKSPVFVTIPAREYNRLNHI